jgi:hypothetical protein
LSSLRKQGFWRFAQVYRPTREAYEIFLCVLGRSPLFLCDKNICLILFFYIMIPIVIVATSDDGPPASSRSKVGTSDDPTPTVPRIRQSGCLSPSDSPAAPPS